jgi:phytanoyl-CoA hydroxylase
MPWLKPLVWFLKRRIQGSPRLYGIAYSAVTFNGDRLRGLADRGHMPSRFGGLWTDRDDFEDQLRRRLDSGAVRPEDEPRLREWRERGAIIFRGAADPARIDALVDEFARLPVEHPPGLQITGNAHRDSRPYDPALIQPHDSIRIVDYYFFSAQCRDLLFDPAIVRFLRTVFEAEPILTQSLSFEHGSEQLMHQDTAFVIMNTPLRFAASWIALEDIREGSGELMYYPGSHRWGDFLFSGRFKHWDRERDGDEQLVTWQRWMDREAERRGVRRELFHAKKGDVLIWHGGLAHGGAPIRDNALTRRSLVGHYCASGTRPLYHYYKPGQRKVYAVDGHRYSSSHYRR